MTRISAFLLCLFILPSIGQGRTLQHSPAGFQTGVVTGTAGPRFFIDLAVESSGIIESYEVKEGQPVRKGDVVLRLKSDEEQSRLAMAESMVEESETMLGFKTKAYNRVKQMFDESVASEQELENRQLELERTRAKLIQAKAERDLARSSLEKKSLRAPVDGIWFRSLKEPGEAIQRFQSAGLLTDPSQLEVTFLCPPSWEEDFELGQSVKVEVVPWSSGPAVESTAEVAQVDPLVDPALMRFRLTLKLDPATARSGQTVRLMRPEPQQNNVARQTQTIAQP